VLFDEFRMATPHPRPDSALSSAPAPAAAAAPESVDQLFHQLNNYLGIVLVNAELLESKAADDTTRSRAGQVVTSVLDALATVRTLRQRLDR
jgi:hypothetical protein